MFCVLDNNLELQWFEPPKKWWRKLNRKLSSEHIRIPKKLKLNVSWTPRFIFWPVPRLRGLEFGFLEMFDYFTHNSNFHSRKLKCTWREWTQYSPPPYFLGMNRDYSFVIACVSPANMKIFWSEDDHKVPITNHNETVAINLGIGTSWFLFLFLFTKFVQKALSSVAKVRSPQIIFLKCDHSKCDS